MKENEKGFTLVELLVAILALCGTGVGIYLIYLLVCALQKYIAS